MFGLIVVVVGVIYLVVLIVVTRVAYSIAKKRGYSKAKCRLAAVGGFLVIYLPVFWDHIPTVVAHQYYCSKDSGFWIYKTLEQWKAENPNVILTQEGATDIQKEEDAYIEIHQINQRLNWVVRLNSTSSVLQVSKREEIIVDRNNDGVLARFIDFSRGNQRSTGTIKIWLVSNDCYGGEAQRVRMGKLVDGIYGEAKGSTKSKQMGINGAGFTIPKK